MSNHDITKFPSVYDSNLMAYGYFFNFFLMATFLSQFQVAGGIVGPPAHQRQLHQQHHHHNSPALIGGLNGIIAG